MTGWCVSLRAERRRRTIAAIAGGLAVWGAASQARAAGPIGPNGSRITTSEYTVDLTQTPVLAGSRVVGLGGAYVAIAEGTDGNLQNAAAPAVRVPWSVDAFDFDFGFGFSFPSSFEDSDFFNSGSDTSTGQAKDDILFLNGAVNLQMQEWGLGFAADYQPYGLTRQDAMGNVDRLDAKIIRFQLQVARSFFDHQLVLGVGGRAVSLSIDRRGAPPGEASLFSTEGGSFEAGALVRPNDQPFRIGVAARSEVLTNPLDRPTADQAVTTTDFVITNTPADPAADPEAIFLPAQAALPWDLHVGAAVQFGPRPFNPKWTNPADERDRIDERMERRQRERHERRARLLGELKQQGRLTPAAVAAVDAELEREQFLDEQEQERLEEEFRESLRQRYFAMERFYVLVTVSALITGNVDNAVGVESFLRQEVDRSGQQVTVTPRLGIETEAIPHWVKVRAGTYYEPTRFDNGRADPRIHGTFGLEAKIFPWTVFGFFDEPTWWRAGAVIDGASRYFSFGLTAGIWH